MCSFKGTEAPGASIDEERTLSNESAVQPAIFNPNVALSIEQQRQKLPIFKVQSSHKLLYLFFFGPKISPVSFPISSLFPKSCALG